MKAKLFKVLAAGLLGGLVLSGCGNKDDGSVVVDKVTSVTLDVNSIYAVSSGETAQLTATVVATSAGVDKTVTWTSSNPSVATVDQNGLVTIVGSEGSAIITASAGGVSATCVVGFVQAAQGVYDYSNLSNEERTVILGKLEKWAVDKKLTGITLFEDGGWTLTNPRVSKGAPAYIKGYGFGTLAEGSLNGPLTGEEETKYQMYYHTYDSSDPANLIYMDDDGGVVPGLLGYCAGGYYDIVMDETRTGYEWCHDLSSNDEPVAVNPDESGASKVYRIPVKTGANFKYSTLSTDTTLGAFNNREVALEDYVTPYKIYFTQAYGMLRNAEVDDDDPGAIKGGEAYKTASATGFNAEAWENIGIKTGNNAELGDYIEFTLNAAVTPFWARYYLSSSMYAPVPEAFINALGGGDFAEGVKLWGKFNNSATLSPKDTFLSTGPYVVEEWVKDSKITYKRNPNYVYGTDAKVSRPSHYYIEGVYVDIITALNTDNEAALKKFEANKLDSCGVPTTKLSEYTSDPRATLVPGSTTTKLNLNTCTQEQWNELFGMYGSISQTAPAKYWECEPAMSNSTFVDALSFSIDRLTYASKLGRTPSSNYFGSGYYSDPENGIFYNDTDAHKEAVAEFLEGTDGYGFSEEKAKAAFKQATDELIAQGKYSAGDTISIEMCWQAASQENTYAKPLAKMIKDVFDASGCSLNLEITHWYPAASYVEVYYDKMMVGQFDIGFGGIEGNAFNPLNFMDVLKSDNSSGFTLNWGIPTNEYAEIIYDNKFWTYDALWEVADHGGYVCDGKNSPLFTLEDAKIAKDVNGNLIVDLKVNEVSVGEDTWAQASSFCFFATTDGNYSDYSELYFYSDGTCDLNYDDDGEIDEMTLETYWVKWERDPQDSSKIHVEIAAAILNDWTDRYPEEDIYTQGIDLYYKSSLLGGEIKESFVCTIWADYFSEVQVAAQ